MNFFDLLPRPDSALKTFAAPFQKREGLPWAQSTLQNFGHAAFGDKVAGGMEQRMGVRQETQPPTGNTVFGPALGSSPMTGNTSGGATDPKSNALALMLGQWLQNR